MSITRNRVDMCTGFIPFNIIRFSMPMLLSNVVQLMFTIVDMLIVGRFAGRNALAAVGLDLPLIELIATFIIGMSLGVSVVTAWYYGAKSEDDIIESVHTAMFFSLVGGLAIAFLSLCLVSTALELMQTPETIIKDAKIFLIAYCSGIPAVMIFNYGRAILNVGGDTRRPMNCMILSGIVKVLLDLLFVIILGMGVKGAASSSFIANTVSAVLMVWDMCHMNGSVKLKFRQLQIHKSKLVEMMRIGLPAGLQGVAFALSSVVVQSAINSFGELTIAGNTATTTIEWLIYTVMVVFSQSASTFISQNLGAQKLDRIKTVLYCCLGYVFLTGFTVSWGSIIFNQQILGLFTTNSDVLMSGYLRMKIVFPIFVICGFNEVMAGSMRGMGYSTTPLVVATLGSCAFRIIWIFTIFQWHSNLEILLLSYPVSWILTFVAHVFCFKILYRKLVSRCE